MTLPSFSGSRRIGFLLIAFSAALSSACAQGNPKWLGRTFVKVLAKGDPIPGADGTLFNEITRFTLHDGTLHIVAGESANKKGLFRWRDGVLSKLVYTDTLAPTGTAFDTVHFTTDETEGAVNFVGEVFYGRPGSVYGLFEWKNGVITRVLDASTPVGGKTLNGFGYPVRVGHEVVGSAQFFEDGQLKTGILRWDGQTLHTVIQTGDDLPGSLGGFTGQPGPYQVAFDGQNVAFVASADLQGRGPSGIYRADAAGTLTKLIDGNDKHPAQNGSKTYFQRGVQFVNVDIDGPYSFLGVGEMVAAAGGNRFYGLGARFTGGTLNVATATFGTDGTYEEVLPYTEADGVTRTRLDGQEWTNIFLVDGQGDDVALLVRLADGRQAIYAAIGPTSPQSDLTMSEPRLTVGGALSFRLVTKVGTTYFLESRPSLLATSWSTVKTISGDGTTQTIEVPLTSESGFFQIRQP